MLWLIDAIALAVDQRPLDKCLQDVANCDIYIGIFAWYYGFIPPNDTHKNPGVPN